MKYRFSIDQAALPVLLSYSPKERRLLVDFMERLAAAPFDEPELTEELNGREVAVRFFGHFTITYWLDHPVKEVRIINIFRD